MMIVLNKKKILIGISVIIIFVFTYIITTYNVKNTNKSNIEAIQTVALPVNSKVIIIDARTWISR